MATGGMAEIFLAERPGDSSQASVVIKRMLPELAVRPDFVQMFLDEARLTATLKHDNVVRVLDLGQADNSYFIAMELVDGPHLGSLFAHSLRARKPLPIELAVWVVARAADGLHYAHGVVDPETGRPLQLVHRDISPQNILVSRHGDVKVTDFGVAKATTQQTKTRTGIVKGKVSYMSPEQCLGDTVDRRTDVFALGIVLYELLTRRRLFKDKSDLLVMQRITNEVVAPPSTLNRNVDAALDAICLQAMSRGLDERYQTAADFADALDGWLVGKRADRATMAAWFDANCAELAATRQPDTDATRISPPPSPGVPTPSFGSAPRQALVDTTAIGGPPVRAVGPSDATVVTPPPMIPTGLPGLSPVEATAVLPEPSPPGLLVDRSRDGPSPIHQRSDVRDGTTPRRDDDSDEGDLPTPMNAGAMALEAPSSSSLSSSSLSSSSLSSSSSASVQPVAAQRRLPPPALFWGAGLVTVALIVTAGALALREPDAPGPTRTPLLPVVATDPGGVPASATGTLIVETTPLGATIIVGDAVVGPSPVTLLRPPGSAIVQAQFEGQPVRRREVVIEENASVTVALDAWVPLVVRSTPSKAAVRLDGELLGETPFDRGYLLEPGVPHTLMIDGPSGYEDVQRPVQAIPGEPLAVDVKLAKASGGPRRGGNSIAASAGAGTLSMRTEPWAVVKVDGKVFGETPFAGKAIPAGRHTVQVQNAELGLKDTLSVTIQKDASLVVILRYEKSGAAWKRVQKTIR